MLVAKDSDHHKKAASKQVRFNLLSVQESLHLLRYLSPVSTVRLNRAVTTTQIENSSKYGQK